MRKFLQSINMVVALLAPGEALAQDGSFTSAGLQLHYTSAGAGVPAVFLSGGPGLNVDYMKSVAEFLPDTYRRIFLEQRGTGRSRPAPAKALTLKTVVEDLESLRLHLKQDRLFLIGHSWGGQLALAYAAEHPDCVDRLILIDSAGPTPKFEEWFSDNIAARLRPEDKEMVQYWTEAEKRGVDRNTARLQVVLALIPAYFFDRAKGLELVAQAKDGAFGEFHADAYDALRTDLDKGYDLRPGLKKLARPVLIVHGHQSPIGDKTAEEIHSAISGSTLAYIRKSGHFPWIEQPEAFRQSLSAFLESSLKPVTAD